MNRGASVVARTVASIPKRSATDTWRVIVDLIAPDAKSDARRELDAIAGVVCSLIADESLADDALLVYGAGPRVRVYAVYGDDAISGDRVQEGALSFVATSDGWRISLPCPEADLAWVKQSLARVSTRIHARKLGENVEDLSASRVGGTSGSASHASSEVDLESFLRG